MSRACPTCKVGELKLYFPGPELKKAFFRELRNPGIVFFDAAKVFLYYQLARHMKEFDGQYECKSCKALAAVCPDCNKLWMLSRPFRQLEELRCPHCSHEFYMKYA